MNIFKNKSLIITALTALLAIDGTSQASAAAKGLSRDAQEKGTHRIMTA